MGVKVRMTITTNAVAGIPASINNQNNALISIEEFAKFIELTNSKDSNLIEKFKN